MIHKVTTVKEGDLTIDRGATVTIDGKDYCVDVSDGEYEFSFRVHCLTDNKSSMWVGYTMIARYNHVRAVSPYYAGTEDAFVPITVQRLCEIVGIM